jgi:hypothetical protein
MALVWLGCWPSMANGWSRSTGPQRPVRRGGKSDALDALRAAREALAHEQLAMPHRRGDREALRVQVTRQAALTAGTCAVNQLKR